MTTTEHTTTSEVWTYTGQRVGSDGKLRHTWLDANNERLSFAKFGGSIIGAHYNVDTVREEEHVSVLGHATYAAPADDDRATDWTVEHRAALAAHELLRRERAAKRDDDPFVTMVAPLREQYGKLIGHARKSGFLAQLIAEVTR